MESDDAVCPRPVHSLDAFEPCVHDDVVHVVAALFGFPFQRTRVGRLTCPGAFEAFDEGVDAPRHVTLVEECHQRIFCPPRVPYAVVVVHVRRVGIGMGVVAGAVAGHQKTVVQRRVEDFLRGFRFRVDLNRVQASVPRFARRGFYFFEIVARNLLGEEFAGVGLAAQRYCDLQQYCARRIERRKCDSGVQFPVAVVCDGHRARRPVQRRGEIDFVGRSASESSAVASPPADDSGFGVV